MGVRETLPRVAFALCLLASGAALAAYALVEPRTACAQAGWPAFLRTSACRAALLRVDLVGEDRARVVHTLALAYEEAGDLPATASALAEGIDGCRDGCGGAATLLEDDLRRTCVAQAKRPLDFGWRWAVITPRTGEESSILRATPSLDDRQGAKLPAGTCVFARTAKAEMWGVRKDFIEVELPRSGRAGWVDQSAITPWVSFVALAPPAPYREPRDRE